jgi:hypothetical protein
MPGLAGAAYDRSLGHAVHDNVPTTFSNYGEVASHGQAETIQALENRAVMCALPGEQRNLPSIVGTEIPVETRGFSLPRPDADKA